MNMIETIRENNTMETQKTIMAVGNAPLMLSILGSIVAEAGYRFTRTKSGKSAMKLIDAYKPDLLILRTDMPDMDGYELAERLNENGSAVPMIFLSDNATKESVVKAHRMGVKDYITWPVDRNTVLNKIAKQIA